MKWFKLYYPKNEGIKEKYSDINYRTLEELYCQKEDDEYTVEFFWVTRNSAGKERCSKYNTQSDALNLFLHDLKSQTCFLRDRLYPEYEMTLRDEAVKRLTPEEVEAGFTTRERWIMCCEEFIEGMGQYEPDKPHDGEFCYEGYSDYLRFKFYLPIEIPERARTGDTLRVYDIGAAVCFKYIFVPFYYALAQYKLDSEGDRNFKKYLLA